MQEEARSTTTQYITVCYSNTELLFCAFLTGWLRCRLLLHTGWSFALCLSTRSSSAKHTCRRQTMSPTFKGGAPFRTYAVQMKSLTVQ